MHPNFLPRKKDSYLIIANTRFWNAEAHYAVNICYGLQKKGHTVFFLGKPNSLAINQANKRSINTINNIDLDSYNPITQIIAAFRLRKFIIKNNITLVNSFKTNGALVIALLKISSLNFKWVRTRGDAKPPTVSYYNKLLYGKIPDGLIGVSKKSAKYLRKIAPHQNITYIYYGSTALKPSVTGLIAKKMLGYTKNDVVFCLLGRTQPLKGHIPLLHAFANTPINCKLLFLIKDRDEYPKQLINIEKTISKLNLTTKVRIMGFQQGLPNILQAVDCGVIPSLSSEINCRVLVEFFSLAIPVIAFKTGTLPELVTHNVNSLLCEHNTSRQLNIKIKIFHDQKKLRAKLAKNAFLQYNQFYTINQMTEQTLSFWQDLNKPKKKTHT